MECKKCGCVLPPVGFNCTNCGTMMNAEQIKAQKDNMESKKNIELVSEKYGHKDFIYQKREGEKNKYLGILILLGIIVLVFLVAIIVYL